MYIHVRTSPSQRHKSLIILRSCQWILDTTTVQIQCTSIKLSASFFARFGKSARWKTCSRMRTSTHSINLRCCWVCFSRTWDRHRAVGVRGDERQPRAAGLWRSRQPPAHHSLGQVSPWRHTVDILCTCMSDMCTDWWRDFPYYYRSKSLNVPFLWKKLSYLVKDTPSSRYVNVFC